VILGFGLKYVMYFRFLERVVTMKRVQREMLLRYRNGE